MNKSPKLAWVRVLFIFSFGIIVMRLFWIMVLEYDKYSVEAHRQHYVERILSANRGEIYYADKYPLVINSSTYMLFAVPIEMEDKDIVNKKLREVLIPMIQEEDVSITSAADKSEEDIQNTTDSSTIEYNLLYPSSLHSIKKNLIEQGGDWEKELDKTLEIDLTELLSNNDDQYVQIVLGLSREQRDSIENLKLKGLHFESRDTRLYPDGNIASHILGIVGKDSNGKDRGYFGLEGFYNGYLSGRDGYELSERDVEGKPIPQGNNTVSEPTHGRDLVLTIEREIQYVVENKLREGVERYGAESGAVIVMDPYSGAVLALASYPTFYPAFWIDDLENETDVSKVDEFRNTAIASNYEPGSVMKPITMSMALNEGLVNPDTIYHDIGPVEYSGFLVRTANNQYSGDITVTQILQLSNNPGAAWVGHQVGFERFADYLSKYRFGSKTGIDLEGEEAGIVRSANTWRDIDLANMSFGQGISVTPIQLVTAFSALVNGGDLYKPYVVKQMVDDISITNTDVTEGAVDTKPEYISSPITSLTSEQLRYMMETVVTNGEFKWFVKQAGMDIYRIGGKTGTAQIPVGGEYDPNNTIVTFIGYAPVEEPKFVMIMKLSKPSTSTYSADTVVPIWMETARDLMNQFGISPRND